MFDPLSAAFNLATAIINLITMYVGKLSTPVADAVVQKHEARLDKIFGFIDGLLNHK